MKASICRYLGLVMLVLLPALSLKAQTISGPTYINFDTGGYSNYDLSFGASFVIGGSSYGTAYAGYGNISASSWSYWGEAGVYYTFDNIRKVNGQWTAESMYLWVFTNAGYYETTVESNVVLPSSGWVTGQAEYNTVYGSLTGF